MAAQTFMPNLVYLGGPKCASTWIFRSLVNHPQCYVPPAKEIFYFNKQFELGIGWYKSFFKDAGPQHRCIADISPSYLYSEAATQRIRETLPDAKLIACVRNPIWRAWSNYLFKKRNGKTTADFRTALKQDPNLLEWGLYARHIVRYQEVFGKDRLRVFVYDDLERDPIEFGRSLYAFLGIDPEYENPVSDKKVLKASRPRSVVGSSVIKQTARFVRRFGFANLVGRVKGSSLVARLLFIPMDKEHNESFPIEIWDELATYFADDVAHLSETLGRDLHHWLVKPEEKGSTPREALTAARDTAAVNDR